MECEVPAEAVDDRLRQAGDQAERAHEDGAGHRRLDPDVAHTSGADPELVSFDRRLTEQLDQRGAGRREALGHLRRHGGIQPRGLTLQAADAHADPARRQDEDRQEDQRHDGHERRQFEHHDQGEQQRDGVGDDAGQAPR